MNGHQAIRSATALKRWSCQDKQVPTVEQVQSIHIYDFDNTRMPYLPAVHPLHCEHCL